MQNQEEQDNNQGDQVTQDVASQATEQDTSTEQTSSSVDNEWLSVDVQ